MKKLYLLLLLPVVGLVLVLGQSTTITYQIPPYPQDGTKFLNGLAQWATPSSGGSGSSFWTNNAGTVEEFPQADYTTLFSASRTNSIEMGHNDSDGAYLQLNSFGTVSSFIPSRADGQTPWHFDTSVAHTSGNLFEQDNNGTNKFAIAFDGAISAGHTNQWKLGALKSCTATTLIVTNYLEIIVDGATMAIPLVTPTP